MLCAPVRSLADGQDHVSRLWAALGLQQWLGPRARIFIRRALPDRRNDRHADADAEGLARRVRVTSPRRGRRGESEHPPSRGKAIICMYVCSAVLRLGSALGRILYPDLVAGAAPEGGPCQCRRRRGWTRGPSVPSEPVAGFTRPEHAQGCTVGLGCVGTGAADLTIQSDRTSAAVKSGRMV